MSEAVAEKAENAPAAASGGGNKKLLIIVLAVNVLLAGGLGYVLLSNKGQAAGQAKAAKAKSAEGHEDGEGEEGAAQEGEHEAAEEEEEEKKDEKHAGAKFGPLVDIGTFVANLQGTPGQQPRYCKVGVYVEVKNEEAKAAVEGAAVPIKAEALMMIANLRPEDVIGKDRMTALSSELQKRANKLIGKNAIKRVFFSELVVQ